MDTLYPSLVLATLAFMGTSVSRFKSFFTALGLSPLTTSIFCFAFIGALFLHFTNPPNHLYFAVLVIFCAWVYLHCPKERMGFARIRRTIIGIIVSVLTWRLSVWYPFMEWHGVPSDVIDAILWVTVVHAMCPDPSDRFGAISAGVLSSVWLRALAMEFHSPLKSLRLELDSSWTEVIDVWWITMTLTFGLRLLALLANKFKVWVFKASI